MSIIAWIVLGAIAGYLAGFLVRGDEGLGVIGHIVLGIVGALVGGFLAEPDRVCRSVKVEPADRSNLGCDQHVGRIAGHA